jgi:hypothetical protein
VNYQGGRALDGDFTPLRHSWSVTGRRHSSDVGHAAGDLTRVINAAGQVEFAQYGCRGKLRRTVDVRESPRTSPTRRVK